MPPQDNQANAGIADDSDWQSDPGNHELPVAHLFATLLKRTGIETDEFARYWGGLDRV